MVKGSPSEALVVIGDGSGFGIGGVGGELQVLNSTVLRCVLKTKTLRMNPTKTTFAHIAHPTTCDVSCTHGRWIFGSRARIRVHITWEKEALPKS